MLSEILKIIPKLDNKDLSEMERTLSSRFKKVASGFGKALKFTLLAAVGGALLQKLLSPLNEVREAIERTLKSADDVVTNATQFNSSPESLLKLRALGSLKGLGPEQVDLLLTKFQTASAQAKASPQDDSVSSVRNYANRKDTVESFFDFIQSVQKLAPDQRSLVQAQIFGEKQILKMAEFLQSDFGSSFKDLKSIDFAKVGNAVRKLEGLEGIQTKNRTLNGLNDLVSKSGVMNKGTISAINEGEISKLRVENERISGFKNAAKIEESINKISENIEKLVNTTLTELPVIMTTLGTATSALMDMGKNVRYIIEAIKQSPWVKGIRGFFGQGKDE